MGAGRVAGRFLTWTIAQRFNAWVSMYDLDQVLIGTEEDVFFRPWRDSLYGGYVTPALKRWDLMAL
jgi:hypothetical protein